MRTKIALLLLFCVAFTAFSQDKQEVAKLTESLTRYKSGEKHFGVKKDKAYRLLSIDKYNHVAIDYLITSFYEVNRRDSINRFFNYLINKHPKEVEPYLIREQYYYQANLSYTARLANLKKALSINTTDERVNYKLGKLYYNRFISAYKGGSGMLKFDDLARNVIFHFGILCNMKESNKETLKYPLIQMASYLHDNAKKKLYESYRVQSSYFAVSDFVGLPNDWRSNYSINVLNYSSSFRSSFTGVELALSSVNGYSKYMEALNEPKLRVSESIQVFRFICLRSFDEPFIVRLENKNSIITIYWKMLDGKGGYELGKIIIDKSKQLTINDWKNFIDKIDPKHFWNIPTVSNALIGTDGSEWLLEGNLQGKYHVVERWCGGEIGQLCRALLNLTDLKIKELY